MTLDQIPVGEVAVVLALRGDPFLRERLAELGFTRGTAIRVVRKAPLGDPLHIRARSGSFAVRADEARCIEVLPEKPTGRES